MKALNILLGFFILITVLSGCGARNINTPAESAEELFVLVNPFKDDPDNPSLHNPFIKKYGDIPEVRTFLRLKQKLGSGTPLTVDEAIELYTADLYLTRSRATETILKSLRKTKQRHERLGFSADTPVFTYTGSVTLDLTRGDSIIRGLPDSTRIISDYRLKDGYVVIPPKETSTDADASDENSEVNEQKD